MTHRASVWIKPDNIGGGFLELLAAVEPDDLPRIDAAIAELKAFREMCVARLTAVGKLVKVPVSELRVVKRAEEPPPGKPAPAAAPSGEPAPAPQDTADPLTLAKLIGGAGRAFRHLATSARRTPVAVRAALEARRDWFKLPDDARCLIRLSPAGLEAIGRGPTAA